MNEWFLRSALLRCWWDRSNQLWNDSAALELNMYVRNLVWTTDSMVRWFRGFVCICGLTDPRTWLLVSFHNRPRKLLYPSIWWPDILIPLSVTYDKSGKRWIVVLRIMVQFDCCWMKRGFVMRWNGSMTLRDMSFGYRSWKEWWTRLTR